MKSLLFVCLSLLTSPAPVMPTPTPAPEVTRPEECRRERREERSVLYRRGPLGVCHRDWGRPGGLWPIFPLVREPVD